VPRGALLPLLGLAPDGVCPARRSPACRWALTPPFHPYPRGRGRRAVSFLWHFPWGHPHWPLASILLCGVRTFLEPAIAAVARHLCSHRRSRSRRRPAIAWPPQAHTASVRVTQISGNRLPALTSVIQRRYNDFAPDSNRPDIGVISTMNTGRQIRLTSLASCAG
jgi:hypothetical protein